MGHLALILVSLRLMLVSLWKKLLTVLLTEV